MNAARFDGWRMVAAVFALTLVGFGSAYTFGAFVAPLQSAFAIGRGTIGIVFGLTGFLYFGLGTVTGPLADRIGARPLAVTGIVLIGGGLLLAATARGATAVLAGYTLGVGLGVGCLYVPVLGLVQRWFVRRRGLASGLAVSGIGVGTLAMPPLAQWLIATWDWRLAYVVLGIVVLAIGLPAALMLRDDPAVLGQTPDGDAVQGDDVAATGLTPREAIRTRSFAFLYISMMLTGAGVFVPFVHLALDAVEQGVGAGQAALLIALIGVGSTAGRFVLGGWADRVGRARAFALMGVGMGVSMAWWAVAPGFWGLATFAMMFGLFYGGWVAFAPALVADLYGRRHVGAIIGALYSGVAIGTLAGPGIAGVLHEATNSYFTAIGASAIATLLGAAMLRGLKASA